jgi:rod shape-determining protein MreC
MNRDTRRARLVVAMLLLTAFTLITLDYRAGSGSPFGVLRSIGGAVVGPLQSAASAITRPIGNAFGDLGHLGSDRAQVKKLQQENAQLRSQLRVSQLDKSRAAEVDKLLGLAGRGQYRILPARVVAIGGALGFEWTATIDVGSRDGIQPDMTVVNGDGLVGRVKRVGPSTSTVLLAIDGVSAVGARAEGSLVLGIVSGHGARPMTFELLDGNSTVHKGERLVTAGSANDRPFVPEVPIGTVTSVSGQAGGLTRTAEVSPFVNFNALDVVGVVIGLGEPSIPRDSVLPPKPTTPPSPATSPAPTSSTSPAPSATPTG